jgi:protein-tyrosine phosphatase
MKILFLCTDNYTRSVTAEMCLRHYINHNNIKDIEVASAGVRADSDISKYSSIHFERMKELEIDTSTFTRIQFQKEFFDTYDVIVGMGIEHKQYLFEQYGEKVYSFNEIYKNEDSSVVVPPPDEEGKYLLDIRKMVDDLLQAMPDFVENLSNIKRKQELK